MKLARFDNSEKDINDILTLDPENKEALNL